MLTNPFSTNLQFSTNHGFVPITVLCQLRFSINYRSPLSTACLPQDSFESPTTASRSFVTPESV